MVGFVKRPMKLGWHGGCEWMLSAAFSHDLTKGEKMKTIRFKSELHPEKWGYEWTNDSMSFWEQQYRCGSTVDGAAGFFQTMGDGFVAHTPTMAAGVEHFTDYCLSLAVHLLNNPNEEFRCSFVDLPSRETIQFLASLRCVDGDRRRWFSIAERKVSAAESKQYDKRWMQIPHDADGTIGGAIEIYWRSIEHLERSMMRRFMVEEEFHSVLYASHSAGERWEKILSEREKYEGDCHAAVRSLKLVADAMSKLDYARRCAECCEGNTRRTMQSAA